MANVTPQTINNIALFWDIENVTPASSDTLFIEGLDEYAEGLGRVVASFAYANWAEHKYQRLCEPLSKRQFKMVHAWRKKNGKNSADMLLVSDAMELLQFYPHIDTYILITSDSDFRPLLLSLRKSGKKVYVVYDIRKTSQDLLSLADSFIDYREMLAPASEEDEEDEQEEAPKRPREYWFDRLAEAADLIAAQDKTASFGAVKTKMKMLNSDFNENDLGFKRFSHFVNAAAKAGYISLSQDDSSRTIEPGSGSRKEQRDGLQAALQTLAETLKKLDGSSKREFHSFTQIGSSPAFRDLNLKALGFSKLKRFIRSAEARGLVETKLEENRHFVRLTK